MPNLVILVVVPFGCGCVSLPVVVVGVVGWIIGWNFGVLSVGLVKIALPLTFSVFLST